MIARLGYIFVKEDESFNFSPPGNEKGITPLRVDQVKSSIYFISNRKSSVSEEWKWCQSCFRVAYEKVEMKLIVSREKKYLCPEEKSQKEKDSLESLWI